MSTQLTPAKDAMLPLEVFIRYDGRVLIDRNDGKTLAVMEETGTACQNADEIVRRANVHDELVGALRSMLHYSKAEHPWMDAWEVVRKEADAALAKAKGDR